MSFLSAFQPYKFENFGYIRLPEIKIDAAEKEAVGLQAGASNFDFLKALAVKGLKKKKVTGADYKDRAIRELKLIKKLSFVDYYLLVWRVTDFCDKQKIGRDFGRGSCAGSLLFYALDVTGIDPLRYELYFERFLSETRAKKKVVNGISLIMGDLAPDVDLDVSPERRSEVVAYLESLFPNRVSKISTVNTLSGKLLVKECSKIVSEFDEDQAKAAAEMIPKKFGFVADIEETAFGKKKDNGEWEVEPSKDFRQWVDGNRKIFDICLKLRDLIKNAGSHPSGYLVSHDVLAEKVPVETAKSGELSCCFDMKATTDLSIKLDLLASRCSTVVARMVDLVKVKAEEVNIDSDPIIYDNLQNLKTPKGLFQIEADFVYRVTDVIKPKNLGELSDVMAIGRPGALAYLKGYSENEGREVHPLFEPILKPTRYYCLYQEQMMQLLHAVGFTLDEAEICRRIVGKKKIEEVKEWQGKIAAKIKEKGLPEELSAELWKILSDSASYSFNKSHAISFGALAAFTTYLKFKFPLQFFQVLLSMTRNEPAPFDEIASIQRELHYFGIKLLPPDIKKSAADFTIEGNDIRFGLASIRGVSDATIQKVLAFRGDDSYKTKFEVFDALKEAGLHIGIAAGLIYSGALQSFGESRSRLVLEAQIYNCLTDPQKAKIRGLIQAGAEPDMISLLQLAQTKTDTKGKPIIPEKQVGTIKKKAAPFIEVYKHNGKNPRLTNYFFERRFLGFSYSETLLGLFISQDPDLINLAALSGKQEKDTVHVVGLVKEVRQGVSKKKKARWVRFSLTDETDSGTIMIFNDGIEEMIEINAGMPKEGNILYARGTLQKGGTIFANTVSVQDGLIANSVKDLKVKEEI